MARLLPEYPDVSVEIISDYTLTDIVAGRYDAGVRLGEQVDKDMIAVPIGPNLVRSVVGEPAYFARRPEPVTPRDLTEHACINLRLPTHGGFFIWDFRKDDQDLNVRVHGRVAFNTVATIRQAALDGLGLAYIPHDMVEAALQDGRLVQVLADWCPPRPGYHLYFPSRRQPSPAFALIVDALRHRA